MTDRPTGLSSDERSAPEVEFSLRWRPLIDRVGGGGGQVRAAKHLNWAKSTVSRDYTGDTLPTDERLYQLCSALQLPVDEQLKLATLLSHARTARKARLRDAVAGLGTDADNPAEANIIDSSDQERAAGEPLYRSGFARWSDGLRGDHRFVVPTVIVFVLVVTAAMLVLSTTTSAGQHTTTSDPQPVAA